MHALRRSNRTWVLGFIEGTNIVRPNPGGIHDRFGRNGERSTVCLDGDSVDVAVRVFLKIDNLGSVHECGVESQCGSASNGHHETSIVGLGVVIEVRRHQLVGREGGEPLECLLF